MKIGVVSDTHVPHVALKLPEALIDGLAGCDLIIHAGDINAEYVLFELGAIAPVKAVLGNTDSPHLGLPESRKLRCGGRSIGITHGFGAPSGLTAYVQEVFPDADVIVFGHSHQPLCRRAGKTLLFNPGSPTDPRHSPQPTYGILEIGKTVTGRIVEL